MVALGIAGAVAEGMLQGAPASPALRFAFAVPMGLAFLVFVVSVPPVAIRFFIAAHERIGNAEHPVVRFLRRHERAVVWAVWILWALGALIALPAAVHDLMSGP